MWKKILTQKINILLALVINIGVIIFFQVFGGMPFFYGIVRAWSSIFSPELSMQYSYPVTSWGLLLFITCLAVLFLWGVRAYIATLFSSLSTLFQILFVSSYIERDSLPKPAEPEPKDGTSSLAYFFDPYTVLDSTGASLNTFLSDLFWIVILGVVFFWIVKDMLKEMVLPEHKVVLFINFAVFIALELLFAAFPDKKNKSSL